MTDKTMVEKLVSKQKLGGFFADGVRGRPVILRSLVAVKREHRRIQNSFSLRQNLCLTAR